MSAIAPAFSTSATADSRTVTRTRRFLRNRRDKLSFLSDLTDLLDAERVTGQVILNVTQGTFVEVVLTESVELKPLPRA